MKVLVLTGSLSVGGAETAMLNLVEMLARKEVRSAEGIDVHLCAFGTRRSFGESTLLEKAKSLQVPFEVVESRRFYDPVSWCRIRRYVKEHDIDLIHSFLLTADIVANLIGWLERIPVVTSLRNVPESYLRARKDFTWLMRHVVLPNAGMLVALSDSIRDTWIEQFGIPAERIVTIQNAASVDEFLALPLERIVPADKTLTVTTVGRLTAQKAHADFIEAAAIVLKQCPHARFRIVGRGELEASLQELAQSLGVEDAIEFAGLRRDIVDIHASSDVFVLSSHWEGMSVAAIEAMAAGLPLVLTRVGANPDLIEDGVHGHLVPPAEPALLAESILSLLSSAEQRLQMGQRARERAIEQFTADSNYRVYAQLYLELWRRSVD